MRDIHELLDRLPAKVTENIAGMTKDFFDTATDSGKREIRHQMQGYVNALNDADLISSDERNSLYLYMIF